MIIITVIKLGENMNDRDVKDKRYYDYSSGLCASRNDISYLYCSMSIAFLVLSGFTILTIINNSLFNTYSVRFYCVVTILIYVGIFLYNRIFLKLDIISLPQIFILVTFMYTSSLLALYAFDLINISKAIRWYNEHYVKIAIKMIITAIFSLEAGVSLAFMGKYIKNPFQEPSVKEENFHDLFILGIIIFGLAISVLVISTFMGSGYASMLQSGYTEFKSNIRNTDVRYFLTALSTFLPVSVLIMVSGSITKNQYRTAYIGSFLTIVAFFMAGDRGGAFSFLIAFVFTLTLLGKRFSNTKIIVGAILVLILIPAIKDLRHQQISRILSYGIELNNEESPFYRAFTETGSSFQTFLGTIMIIPEIEDYRYGYTYISAISKLVPNFGAWVPPSLESRTLTSWITYYMNPGGSSGLGFLQIAEFYAQFGVFGIFAGFFIAGYLLTRWQKKCESGYSDRKWIAVNGCILCFLLIWIRNDIFTFIRPAAWSVMLILGWSFVLNKKCLNDKLKI